MKKNLLAASLFFIVLFACKTKDSGNTTVVYDSRGKIDTVFTYRRTDTLQIPDLYDPGILHDTIIISTAFKNYDNGKLISSGMYDKHNHKYWSLVYYQKTKTTEILPNGNKVKTQKLGPDIIRQIAYRPDGTKLYEDNPVKYTYTIYDAKGKIDTLKYQLRCDTIQIPDLESPDILHDTIIYAPKFKHYSSKKLVSQGGLYNNKPYGDVLYYDKKKVVKTEKYDTQGKLLRIIYHH